MTASTHQPVKGFAEKATALKGEIQVPGDKSISHRALLFGGLAVGETIIHGLLEGEDVMSTAAALRLMGVEITRSHKTWQVMGRGLMGLQEPTSILDMGNSGTSARLLMGIAAAYPYRLFFTGDASLNRRPMSRVATPLQQMGASFSLRQGKFLPGMVEGSNALTPLHYAMPVASAQVKSAILLAGLHSKGTTTVVEASPTRDHTEKMLRYFGAKVDTGHDEKNQYIATVHGLSSLTGKEIIVPTDPSSAAFFVAAALLVKDSCLTISGVGINPLRTGFYEVIKQMGADINFTNIRESGGEPVADIVVRHSALQGVDVPETIAPSMIDEYPILAVLASFAHGTTTMRGLAELRVKESDRLALMAQGLADCGVNVRIEGDDLIVTGNGKAPQGGGQIHTALDHRIAMSFLVMGLASAEKILVNDISPIATSFPNFISLMQQIGAIIHKTGGRDH